MKRFTVLLTVAIAILGITACNWFKGDDPVGPPSLDIQYQGSITKASGATYETWSIEINFPNRGNSVYSDRLASDGSFVFMAPWPPSEPHIVTIIGVSNTEVWQLPNVNWTPWGTNTYKFDFQLQ